MERRLLVALRNRVDPAVNYSNTKVAASSPVLARTQLTEVLGGSTSSASNYAERGGSLGDNVAKELCTSARKELVDVSEPASIRHAVENKVSVPKRW